ncbi:tRNA(Ile)-lysidine synthase [Bacteroidia bacterium]|nr:tRNA(Ile)-lysidine synthase [Bacteroidia bacterium]
MLNPNAITEFLKQHHISTDAKFLLGVSGGADSMSLLLLFHSLKLSIEVMHCNFQLRGAESDGDQAFVEQYCNTRQIPFHTKRFDTAKYASDNTLSIEMAARELRYDWFTELKQLLKADYIVIAHNADDVAETVLINFCRGTGIKGLSGIKAVNGNILRPLLPYSKAEIVEYLRSKNISYRTDSSNCTDEYTRNLVRHKIIPIFKELNPSFLHTVQENCAILFETETIFLDAIAKWQYEIIEQHGDELCINIHKVCQLPAPLTFLHETFSPYGFNKTQTENIFQSASSTAGKKFYSDNYCLVKDRDCWRLYRKYSVDDTLFTINKEGEYIVDGKIFTLKTFPKPSNFIVPKTPETASFDADKLQFPLTIRHWKKSDAFQPFGMKGRKKKLSDFFTDLKFTAKQKDEALVMLSNGNIIWIIGLRTDERFKVDDATQTVSQIET